MIQRPHRQPSHIDNNSRPQTRLLALFASAAVGALIATVGAWAQSAPVSPPITPAVASAPVPPKPLISSELGGRELTYLHKANEHTLVLMYLADLGKKKGSTEPVRALGELLNATESKELDQLIALGVTKGITFPSGQPGLVKRLSAQLDPLEKEIFDRAWLGELTAIIRASIQNLTSGATLSDAEIKKHAENALALANQKLGVVEKVAKQ